MLGVGRWTFFFVCLPHNCAHRHLYDFIRAGASRHFLPHPMPAVFRLDQRLVENTGKVIDMVIRAHNHITTASAIATVRAAFRHKFLPSKTDAPAPACSRLCKSFYSIDEHPADR